jgi:hypothetical protein
MAHVIIRAVRKRMYTYPSTKRYRMKSTGRIATLVSYDEERHGECNTITIDISRNDNNNLLFERQVFGVEFEDLEVVKT